MKAKIRMVDVFIVGAQKAGTTSLKEYLGQHPSIFMHSTKEMTYFLNPQEWQSYDSAFRHFYGTSEPGNSLVSAKNVGVMISRKALLLLREHNPNLRIIVMLRDPVERAHSAYWFARRRGIEPCKNFQDALLSNSSSDDTEFAMSSRAYLRNGRYVDWLDEIVALFPREHVWIELSENLRRSPRSVMADLFGFLGVDRSYLPDVESAFNESAKARSERLARWLGAPNAARALARRILPRGLHLTLGRRLRDWNETPITKPLINEAVRHWLDNYYRIPNEELAARYHLDLRPWACVTRCKLGKTINLRDE